MHSQRLNEPPLKPWVIVSSAGKVECAHCTCMAGIAVTCTHVGALLFKLEVTDRLHLLSCTKEDIRPANKYAVHSTSHKELGTETENSLSKAVGLSGMKKYYAQYAQHIAAAPSSALLPCLAKSLYDESINASDLSAVLLSCEKHMNAEYGCLEVKCPFKYRSCSIQQALDMKDKDFYQEFWEPPLQKAQDFFKKVCLPELAAKYYSKDMQPHVPGEREQ
ncbi:Leucine carboxyl methyltransferase 1 [Labeo rohita]|uniref:Leucine carboxyl methyltransferase 1 n=1 Tax=Labeo rohita TaxID=84645 RepID=A0ABQ8L8D6_LABRO|nr:Leucine carboxyl methyltransferase 1 [Labeo rohita]